MGRRVAQWVIRGGIGALLLAVVIVGVHAPHDLGRMAPAAGVAIALLYGLLRILGRPPAPPAGAAGSHTVEVPFTPVHAEALARATRFSRRLFGGLALGICGVMTAVGVAIGLTMPDPARSAWQLGLAIGAPGALAGLVIAASGWWTTARLRRDQARGTFLRTTGTISAQALGGATLLELADRSFYASSRIAIVVPDRVPGTVDHTLHAHFVFEIRAEDSRALYQDSRYRRALESLA